MVLEGWWRWSEEELGEQRKTMVCILAAIVAILIGCIWWMKVVATRGKPPLPPGPRGLPLVGNLPFLDPNLHIYFSNLSQKFGHIFKIQLGSKICVVVNSAGLARQILKEDDAIFANRDPPLAALVCTYGGLDLVWRPNDTEWRNLRKVFVRLMMNKKNLDACYWLRRREVREMVKEMYAKVGEPIRVADQIFLTTLNVIMSMLWGASLDEDKKISVGMEFKQVIDEFVDLLGKPNISDFFPVLAPLDLQRITSKMKKLSLWFDRIFESVIAMKTKAESERMETNDGKKDLLGVLLELIQEQGDGKTQLSITDIKALFLDVLIGATDTSSTTVEWTMAELLQNPDIMKKAQEELDRVVGNENIVEEFHLQQLHYLDAVVKESMRLHPPTPLLIPHSCSVSTSVAGYTIPKGSRVFINVWLIMRDAETWKNPVEFQPERFVENPGFGDFRGNNFNYLPFGSGRRICAGISLAEKMVMHMLATLLHSFDWRLPDATNLNLSERFGIVMKKSDPLVAIATARLPTSKQYSAEICM